MIVIVFVLVILIIFLCLNMFNKEPANICSSYNKQECVNANCLWTGCTGPENGWCHLHSTQEDCQTDPGEKCKWTGCVKHDETEANK